VHADRRRQAVTSHMGGGNKLLCRSRPARCCLEPEAALPLPCHPLRSGIAGPKRLIRRRGGPDPDSGMREPAMRGRWQAPAARSLWRLGLADVAAESRTGV